MRKKRLRRKSESLNYLIAIVLLAVAIVWMASVNRASDEVAISPESSTSQGGTSTDSVPTSTTKNEFLLLESKEPTLQGRNGYFTQEENGEEIWKRDKAFAETWCTEETSVANLKTFLGNQVYAIPASAITGDSMPAGAESTTVYVQLYGYSPNIVDQDGYVKNTSIWMREEYTGKRIYVFRTQDELADAQKAWEEGQAILNGTSSKSSALIVNGRLIEGGYPALVDGEWYIPLTYVAEAVNPDLYYNNTDARVLTIPLQGCYAGATISVPYTLGSPGVQKMETFVAGNYNSNLGESAIGDHWSDNFRTGDGGACYVPASELSRYTGWYIYSNGESIHVVTDETDVSDLFLLNSQGNRAAESQLDNGSDTVVKYTDPDDGKLHDMMVKDGEIVETPTVADSDGETGQTVIGEEEKKEGDVE